jgi:hypothetical protein
MIKLSLRENKCASVKAMNPYFQATFRIQIYLTRLSHHKTGHVTHTTIETHGSERRGMWGRRGLVAVPLSDSPPARGLGAVPGHPYQGLGRSPSPSYRQLICDTGISSRRPQKRHRHKDCHRVLPSQTGGQNQERQHVGDACTEQKPCTSSARVCD